MNSKLYANTRATFDESVDLELTKPLLVNIRISDSSGNTVDVSLSAEDAIRLGHQIQVSAINGFCQFAEFKAYKEV